MSSPEPSTVSLSHEDEATEYEGDYDTDIASNDTHKHALKSHMEDTDQESSSLPNSPPIRRQAAVLREQESARQIPELHEPHLDRNSSQDSDVPTRQSADMPRAAPPPPPRVSALPQRQSKEYDGERALPKQTPQQAVVPSRDHFLAADVDLAETSHWWSMPESLPPSLHDRTDVLFEIDENIINKRGRKISSTDIYVLYVDYSQTVVSVQYDMANPKSVLLLEQRHQGPPQPPSQAELQETYAQIGASIAQAVESAKDCTVGDGSAYDLVLQTIKSVPRALLPVDRRAFGALLYANSSMRHQSVVIRAGDIVTFHHRDDNSPEHVGVIHEWDPVGEKVCVWEQGRVSEKVSVETLDLIAGEINVWRVMGRESVGWEN